MEIDILQRINEDDDNYEIYQELKDQTYHLENDVMTMGFRSIISEDRIEIPIQFDIKNNVIIIHNYEEIKSFQKHYHEEYLITESVINSIIEEFAFSLRYKEERDSLGVKFKCFEEEDRENEALEISNKLGEFESRLDALLIDGEEIVEELKGIGINTEAEQFKVYLLNRIKSFLDGDEMFKFSSVFEELNEIINGEEE